MEVIVAPIISSCPRYFVGSSRKTSPSILWRETNLPRALSTFLSLKNLMYGVSSFFFFSSFSGFSSFFFSSFLGSCFFSTSLGLVLSVSICAEAESV